mmetsp:Transcript_42403/g.130929  ORF Transcript_42403/g.130929 Transcript_42403/m.130929 type:complete len:407 (+) Transcript_42403:892-2112(+)
MGFPAADGSQKPSVLVHHHRGGCGCGQPRGAAVGAEGQRVPDTRCCALQVGDPPRRWLLGPVHEAELQVERSRRVQGERVGTAEEVRGDEGGLRARALRGLRFILRRREQRVRCLPRLDDSLQGGHRLGCGGGLEQVDPAPGHELPSRLRDRLVVDVSCHAVCAVDKARKARDRGRHVQVGNGGGRRHAGKDDQGALPVVAPLVQQHDGAEGFPFAAWARSDHQPPRRARDEAHRAADGQVVDAPVTWAGRRSYDVAHKSPRRRNQAAERLRHRLAPRQTRGIRKGAVDGVQRAVGQQYAQEHHLDEGAVRRGGQPRIYGRRARRAFHRAHGDLSGRLEGRVGRDSVDHLADVRTVGSFQQRAVCFRGGTEVAKHLVHPERVRVAACKEEACSELRDALGAVGGAA